MDEIIELIEKYWRFDDNQQPMSNWHDKQDLIELLRSKQTGTNTPVSCRASEQREILIIFVENQLWATNTKSGSALPFGKT